VYSYIHIHTHIHAFVHTYTVGHMSDHTKIQHVNGSIDLQRCYFFEI